MMVVDYSMLLVRHMKMKILQTSVAVRIIDCWKSTDEDEYA